MTLVVKTFIESPLSAFLKQCSTRFSRGQTKRLAAQKVAAQKAAFPMPMIPVENPPQDILRIKCPDPTSEDTLRDSHLVSAQRLARQERWEELSQQIALADRSRKMTPGSMSHAELKAYGARADVVSAAEHALMDGKPAKGASLLAGIEALEQVLAEHKSDPYISSIVAQAHMDIAWAWRGTGWETDVPARNRDAFNAHFDRASEIMHGLNPVELDAPLIAGTNCALLAGQDKSTRTVAERYETLIDLNPQNPRSMRALGNHLLPKWHGNMDALELEARRTAARTQDIWGAGAYTWVQFDAISADDNACANVDLPFFIEGLHDILERKDDPYTANVLAAYCANSMGHSLSASDEADQIRAQISNCAHWIVRNHMTELHPMVWAHAAQGFDNNFKVRSAARFAASGREDAVRVIISLFRREIADGKKVVFTDTGAITQAT